jgi:hypothetical protein
MTKTTKRIIIGAAALGVGYAVWRFAIKPRMVAKRVQKLQNAKSDIDRSFLIGNTQFEITNPENINPFINVQSPTP